MKLEYQLMIQRPGEAPHPVSRKRMILPVVQQELEYYQDRYGPDTTIQIEHGNPAHGPHSRTRNSTNHAPTVKATSCGRWAIRS